MARPRQSLRTHEGEIVNYDFNVVERLASQLCALNGGTWDRKRTKKNVWRIRVMRMLDMLAKRA